MTTTEWLANYYTLNNSFKKKLVFRLGVDSGYFSEYNNMVLAMLYCLKHHVKFELYSDLTHFALRDGWNDFFVPFGNTNHQRINKDYNLRPYIIEQSKEAPLQKVVKYKYITAAYKALFGIDFLTQDLWAFHFVRSAGLPNDEFISLHVRAGDKFTETEMFDFSEYMKPALELSHNRKAFILTDDFTVMEQLRTQYPDWEFYTLCEPTERGYFHRDFVRQNKEFKYRQHLKLFANMDICAASNTFVGTYSSNPGMYMGMRIGQERCHCLDFDKWLIW
jgi:hypothetical protein